jgi:hypothetical protein
MGKLVKKVDNADELSLEERAEIAKKFPSKLGANIQLNKAGDVFLRHASFQAWSVGKQKTYTAGANINAEVLRALCSNEMLQAEVLAFLDIVPSQIGMTEEEKAQHVEQFKKPTKAKS